MINSVGVVRFSVLSTVYNKFQAWNDQPFKDYAKVILDDKRMQSRFQLFENTTLPSFDAQTEKSFALLVVAPRLLDDKWRDRLSALQRRYRFLRVFYVHEKDFRMSHVSQRLVDEIVPDADYFSTFRVDDDDAMKEDFIQRLSYYHRRAFVGFGVSFSKGHYLDIDFKSGMYGLRPKQRTNIGAGLAFIGSKEKPQCIFDISDGHLNFHTKRSVVVDGRKDAFLVLNHDSNDTEGSRHGNEYPLTIGAVSKEIANLGYRVNLAGLLSARRDGLPDLNVSTCVGCGEEHHIPSKHNHDDFCDKCTEKENGA